jgi:hypothetical protein
VQKKIGFWVFIQEYGTYTVKKIKCDTTSQKVPKKTQVQLKKAKNTPLGKIWL